MKVKVYRTVERPVGMYLVRFTPIWGTHCNEDCKPEEHTCLDNEPDHVSEVDGEIVKITKTTPDADNMSVDDNSDDCGDDTHDLRDRLFKTESEAKEHLEYTLKKFKNPMPWQSFVKL